MSLFLLLLVLLLLSPLFLLLVVSLLLLVLLLVLSPTATQHVTVAVIVGIMQGGFTALLFTLLVLVLLSGIWRLAHKAILFRYLKSGNCVLEKVDLNRPGRNVRVQREGEMPSQVASC